MRYVQRDPVTKEVVGHYEYEHAYARERLHDKHPDILAFMAKAEDNRTLDQRIKDRVKKSAWARGMTRVLAARFGMTEEELTMLILEASKDG